MDLPLAGIGVFGGWIVLVLASDIIGIMRVSSKNWQSGLLLFAITAGLGCGFLYLQERHPLPCAAAHARR
ncbi:MAG: hypothetical protein IAI49_11155 [Candidatus Eremiobacteraeota bacterium]|nr:hypothetical protein [Candidatus Eremiobacteraeota bacterium]